MFPPRRQLTVTILSSLLVIGLVAGVAAVAAHQHTLEDAPDMSDSADFTVALPNDGDHYPGDQNPEGGSIQYFASGAEAFNEMGAEEGVFVDTIFISAEWIDYSACETANTEAFGIDRGNNNDGVEYDDDLLDHQRRNRFHDSGIDIWFYNWDDFAGNPPYLAPEDAIVAAQGAGSSAGPCLTMTSEPGWYQIQGFANGTVADNGPDDRPSDGAEQVGMNLNSNYLYVCECDSRAEAEEQLGPAPDDGSASSTEPEGTDDGSDDTEQSDDATEQDDGADAGDGTEQSDDAQQHDGGDADAGDGTEQSDDAQQHDGGDADAGDDGTDADVGDQQTDPAVGGTPTPGDGPGFGPAVALLALLAGAGLMRRRG